jgi:hypothetical protein
MPTVTDEVDLQQNPTVVGGLFLFHLPCLIYKEHGRVLIQFLPLVWCQDIS